MKTPTKRATRRLAASLAIATALAAAQSAWAGYWDWVGKGAGETSYFDDYGTPASKKINGCWYLSLNNGESANFSNFNHNFSNAGGTRPTYNPGWDNIVTFRALTSMIGAINLDAARTITFVAKDHDSAYGIDSTNLLKLNSGANLAITSGTYRFSQIKVANDSAGKSSTLTVNGASASLAATGELSIGYSDGDGGSTGHMDIGDGATVSAGGNFALNAGDVTINGTVNVGGNFVVGNYHPGTLTINGGTVTVDSGGWTKNYKGTGTINLNGGTLVTKAIVDQGEGTMAVNFNGGTLKANAEYGNGLFYHSTGNGLTVNVNNGGGIIDSGNYAISIPVAISGTGGMTFTGGNTITLTGAVSYSGQTSVTPGTTLAIANATTKTNILKNGLVLAGLPVADQTVVTSTSAFEDDDLAKVSCSLAPTTTFKFTDETKTAIAVDTPGATINYWTGAADNDLSNDANWSSGTKPTGDAYIICATPTTLTKVATFAPTSITFLVTSAPVTINGDFSGITQIANNSSSRVEFTGSVAFAGNVDVLQNTGIVKFTGGATGTWLARAMDLHGTYTFTGMGDRIELAGTTVKSDGVYNLPSATFYKHNGDFHMEAGGRAEVKAAKIAHKTAGKQLLGDFNGEFKVKGEFVVQAGNGADYPTHYTCHTGNGTFIVDTIRVIQNACIVPCKKTIMGPGGIIRGAGYVRVLDSGSHAFGSYDDWTMYYNNLGNTTTAYFVLYKRSSSDTWSTVTFDTTDYYNNTIGRKITSEAQIGAENAESAAKFRVTVKGIGKFVFANTHDDADDDKKIFSGGLTVTNSATVEVMANSCPGTGPVTLSGTSTLLMHTNSIARTGAIVVNDGATLKVAESGTVNLGGDLRLNDGATLSFNFTDRKNAPVLDLTGREVTFGSEAQVKVSLSGDRPIGEKHILTSGSQIEGMASFVKADDCPSWVKDVGVDDDGNLYVSVNCPGICIIVR